MLRMSKSENIVVVKKILMDNLVISPQLHYKTMLFTKDKKWIILLHEYKLFVQYLSYKFLNQIKKKEKEK